MINKPFNTKAILNFKCLDFATLHLEVVDTLRRFLGDE